MNSNSQSFLREIEQSYNKLNTETSKKSNNIKDAIEEALKSIDSLKELYKTNIDIFTQISKEITLLLLPLRKVIEMKLNLLYISSIEIIKILVKYNVIPLTQTNDIISLIKDIIVLVSEHDYIKIVDVLITMVNSRNISINEETIEKLMMINLKLFSINCIDLNNPLKGLFVSLMKIVYDPIQNCIKQLGNEGKGKNNLIEESNSEHYKASLWLFKSLINIVEGKNKDMITPSIYSKCLALELLSQILDNDCDIFINIHQLNIIAKEDLTNALKKMLETNNDNLITIKQFRCISILLKRFHIGYNLIPYIIKYAEMKEVAWIKWFGLETISSILDDGKLVNDLSINQKYYEDILLSLSRISQTVNLSLSNHSSPGRRDDTFHNKPKQIYKKYLENDCIYTEGDQTPALTINITIMTISYTLLNCYENLNHSLILILFSNDISIGSLLSKKDNYFSNENSLQKQLAFKSELISDTFNSIIDKANYDDNLIQSYLILYQNFINIYGTIGLYSIRDEFFKGLCGQAIPLNIQMLNELTEKHCLIIRSLFNIASCYHLFDFDSWVILLHPLQCLFYLLENKQETSGQVETWNVKDIKRNIEKNMILYSNSTSNKEIKEIIKEKEIGIIEMSGVNNNNKGNKNTENCKREYLHQIDDSNNLYIISISLEKWLIDSDLYADNIIKDIANAINLNCQQLLLSDLINPIIISYIKFNLKKLFELSWVNYQRINLIWSSVMIILYDITLISEKYLTIYSIDICTALIINSIHKFKVKSDRKEEEWNELNYERTLISSLLTFANKNITEEVNLSVLNSLSAILKECGAELNVFGWSSFIEICSFVLNKNIQIQSEFIFKIYETIINEYSSYINPYNIRPLLTSLGIFSSSTINDTIPFMSIELFKSCANVTESYQKGKVNMKQSDIKFFNDFLPDDQIKEDFYNEIWRNLFFKLLPINSDTRKDIRKTCIIIFSEIFSLKISNMSLASCDNIISEVFYLILQKNSAIFKEKMMMMMKKNKVKDNIVNEWEESTIASLQGYKNVIVAYWNKNNHNSNKKMNEYFESYIFFCNNLLSCCRIEFVAQLIQEIDDLYNTNSKLIISNSSAYWKLLNKFGEYLSNKDLLNQNDAFLFVTKMLVDIINNVNMFFVAFLSNDLNELNIITLNYFLSYYHKLLSIIETYEKEEISKNPDRLVNTEKDIFDLIDKIAKKYSTQKTLLTSLYHFYCQYLCYNSTNEHSEALCRRSLQSIKTLFLIKTFDYEEYIKELFDKIKKLFSLRSNIDIALCLIKNKPKQSMSNSNKCNIISHNKGIYLWSYISLETIEIIKAILITKELNESIWNIIISYITIVISQDDFFNNKQIPKCFIDQLIITNQDIEIEVTNFMIEHLLCYSSTSFSKTIQNQLLNLIEKSSSIEYSSIPNISTQISKNSISNIIDLCKFRTKDELSKGKENWTKENIDQYIHLRIKISKTCTPILIKRCRDIMRKFLIDEIKNGSMPLSRARIEEIKFILENMRNLEIYPHYTVIDDETHLPDEDGLEDKETVMGVVAKTKKAHLFLLHPILSEFISTKENDIKLLIKDIFRRISKEMGIKSTLTIIESFYGK